MPGGGVRGFRPGRRARAGACRDGGGGKWRAPSGVAGAPVGAKNGWGLFFVGGGSMQVVAIHPGPPFSAGPPRTLFAIPERVRAGSLAGGIFALAPDDQRFLMVRENSWTDMAGTPTVVVVEHFFEELRQKLKQ